MNGIKKIFRLALLTAIACAALGTVASAAQAEATWVVNNEVLPEGQKFEIPSCSVGEAMQLKGTILGGEFSMTANGGCEKKQILIWNEKGLALWLGKFVLTGGKVAKPAGCGVPATITTEQLTGKAIENEKLGTKLAVTYVPVAGEKIATVKVEGCAIAGAYALKGTFAAEVEPLNVFLEEQPYKFSPAINTTMGDALTLGGAAATLSGNIIEHFK